MKKLFAGIITCATILLTGIGVSAAAADENNSGDENVQSEIVFVGAGFDECYVGNTDYPPESYKGIFVEKNGNIRSFSFEDVNEHWTFGYVSMEDIHKTVSLNKTTPQEKLLSHLTDVSKYQIVGKISEEELDRYLNLLSDINTNVDIEREFCPELVVRGYSETFGLRYDDNGNAEVVFLNGMGTIINKHTDENALEIDSWLRNLDISSDNPNTETTQPNPTEKTKTTTAVTTTFSVFASANSNEYELDLTCSSTKYFDDEDTTTYFYVETDYEGESITLVNADDLTEYTMLDDGKFSISGDDMPYDAVYSLRLELNTDGVTYENPKVLSFYAITEDGVISDTITIKIIKRITILQISEMASVDEMINTLVESENYTSASFEEKTSMVYDLLVNLAEHGTEEYPYSLIFSNSISFTGTIYSFKYSCGSLGGVPIADPFQTTEPTGVGGTTTETTVTTTVTTTLSTSDATTATTTLTTPDATTTTTVTTTITIEPDTEQTTEPPATDAGGSVTTETSTVPPTTTTGTETTLPQTGYSKWYQALIAAAMGMIGVGSTAIVRSGIFRKKENNS